MLPFLTTNSTNGAKTTNLCNSNWLLLTEQQGRHFWSLRSIHGNCSRPETRQEKRLFLVASISVIHGPSLCSHYTPVPPSGLPPRDEKEGKYPAWCRTNEGVGSLPTGVGGLCSPHGPPSHTFCLLLWGKGRVRRRSLSSLRLPVLQGPSGAGILCSALAATEDSEGRNSSSQRWESKIQFQVMLPRSP